MDELIESLMIAGVASYPFLIVLAVFLIDWIVNR